MGDVRLILGDCLEIMPTLPDKSVDMILCDLPYGTTACKWDTVIPFEPLWKEYKRLIKDRGAIVLTASQPFTSALVMSNPTWFKYEWIWNKKKPSNFLLMKSMPAMIHEAAVVFGHGRLKYSSIMTTGVMRNKTPAVDFKDGNGWGTVKWTQRETVNDQYYPKSIIEISNAMQRGKTHPAQKPVALFEYLIRTYTNAGETVLDNCAGSGTTGVACLNTGRDFILIEKDPGYFAIIEKRIAEAQAQIALPMGEATA